eukprot:5574641-Prymnesium_polylepis.1
MPVPSQCRGHLLSIALMIGKDEAVYSFDTMYLLSGDLSPPIPPSPPPLRQSVLVYHQNFEGDASEEDVVVAQDRASVRGGAPGQLFVQHRSTAASNEGDFGLSLDVSRAFDEKCGATVALRPRFSVPSGPKGYTLSFLARAEGGARRSDDGWPILMVTVHTEAEGDLPLFHAELNQLAD